MLAGLPPELEAPLVVVLHLGPNESRLAAVLGRRTLMPVKQAEPGDVLVEGHVFVAPPGAHLLVNAHRLLELGLGPPVRLLRPSVDIFLTSFARAYGPGALAVVLSGAGHDGAAGSGLVRLGGGRVIAQDRATSQYFGMPGAAVDEGAVDRVLPLGEVASAIVEFVRA